MPEVETAVNAAADLINNDWPNIKAGIQKAADAIRKGEQEVDLGEVIKLLKLDATKKVTSLHNLLSYKPMRFIQSQITVQLAPRFILHYVCGSALFFFQVLLRQNTI